MRRGPLHLIYLTSATREKSAMSIRRRTGGTGRTASQPLLSPGLAQLAATPQVAGVWLAVASGALPAAAAPAVRAHAVQASVRVAGHVVSSSPASGFNMLLFSIAVSAAVAAAALRRSAAATAAGCSGRGALGLRNVLSLASLQ